MPIVPALFTLPPTMAELPVVRLKAGTSGQIAHPCNTVCVKSFPMLSVLEPEIVVTALALAVNDPPTFSALLPCTVRKGGSLDP